MIHARALRPALAACLVASACLYAREPEPERPAPVRAWEHETSDLPLDPVLRFGHFPNGLRWVWAQNPEPRSRSYLRLHVNVGSLAEEDAERGLAHFLEHMAFNGSEHFPAGTLVEWFQRHGMAFGADLNAHTDFGETVYKLDLPESDEKTLDEGLLVLSDFAGGLLLEADEIEAEKGVVDGEERERDSPGFRVFVRQLESLLGATRLDERIPIGVREVRARFTPESVRAFYERWYRPEHMTLVLVGDLGEFDPVPLFAKHFADLPRPAEPLRAEPARGLASGFPLRECFHEPEIPAVTLVVDHLRPWEDEPCDSREWLEDLPLDAARRILDLRFEEKLKEASAPFLGAAVGSAEMLEAIDGEELTIHCAPERWREALAAGEQELRRAFEHGFQAAELEEVRANWLRQLDEAAERERTRSSSALVNEILQAAEHRYVPTSAVTDREILRPAIEGLTVEDCQRALVEAWSQGELVLYAVGNLDLGTETAGVLDEAWAASRAVAVEKPAEIGAESFAYSSSEETGPIAERETVADLDLVRVRFANGVALDVKRTDFKEQQVLINAELGEGLLSLEPIDAWLAFLADRVFAEGGLEAHSTDDLRRLTAGKQVGLRFGVRGDCFGFSGGTTREDLLLQLELLCAYLQAPGWREDGLVQLRRGLPLMYEGLARQHQGPVLTDFMDELFGSDRRFVFPAREALEQLSLSMEPVRAWIAPFLADAPLEVAIVGDLDIEKTIHAAARTLGKLPPRRAPREYAEHRRGPEWRSGVAQEHAIDTDVQKTAIMLVFRVPDGIDIERLRRLKFLAEVVRDRLRLEVRERLGAAYSPNADVQISRLLAGFGMLMIEAMTEPAEAGKLLEACLAVTDALAAQGVTEEEVERLRAPMLEHLRDSLRQNGYWSSILAEVQRRPAALDEHRSREASLRAITAAELSALAKAHLARENAARVVVNPRAPSTGEAGNGAQHEGN